MNRFPILIALGLLLACDGEDRSYFDNVGTICFTSTPTESVKARVTFPTCLSSSCDHPENTVCGIKLVDGEIRVGSHAEVVREGGSCTDDCGSLNADCESAPIAAGTYTVTYGQAVAELTLPAQGQILFGPSDGFSSCP